MSASVSIRTFFRRPKQPMIKYFTQFVAAYINKGEKRSKLSNATQARLRHWCQDLRVQYRVGKRVNFVCLFVKYF